MFQVLQHLLEGPVPRLDVGVPHPDEGFITVLKGPRIARGLEAKLGSGLPVEEVGFQDPSVDDDSLACDDALIIHHEPPCG